MNQRRMRAWAGLAAVSLLAGAAACMGRDPVATTPVVQYNLVRIDSQPLPHQVDQSPDGSVTTVVTDMVLSVAEDATWHSIGHKRVTTNGVPATQLVQSSGTYVASGSAVTFRSGTGDTIWHGTFTFPPTKYTLIDAQSHEYVFCRSDFDAAQCGVAATLTSKR